MAPTTPAVSLPLAKRPRRAARWPALATAATNEALAGLLPDDPLAAYALPCRVPLGDKTVACVRAATGTSLSPADRMWAFRAVERALRPMYDRLSSSAPSSASASSMRWSPAEKRRELRAAGQRFLLVQRVDSTSNISDDSPAAAVDDHASRKRGQLTAGIGNYGEIRENERRNKHTSAWESPLAFISFRADVYDEDVSPKNSSGTSRCPPAAPPPLCPSNRDPSDPATPLSSFAQRGIQSLPPPRAVYVYELFVSEHARGRGIGRALMRLLEEICMRAQIFRIVLTVFHENHAAIRLYKEHLGYVVDRSSPSLWGVRDANYEILSKCLRDD
jgi:ribosomal protein S18 acetylase RimI-like enzyme